MELGRAAPRLLRVTEAAELLGISRSATYQLLADGVLPTIRIGRSIRIPSTALDAWITEHTTPGSPAPLEGR